MEKKHYISIAIFISLVLSSILIFAYVETPNENYMPLTIRHLQYFDSSEGVIITGEKKGISSGDFLWGATGYKYGGKGSINSYFRISMHPYKDVTVSRMKKIENTDFDSVSRSTCSKTEYDQSDEQTLLRVNDGDVLCLTLDKNRDGVFGDSYLKLKINSHADSSKGTHADSMTFIHKVL